jgi:NAD(P)-dependent dehydrogenase (short-subunit alcohol dehydrogenase family)
MNRLKDKVAIITGGASGIGAATVQRVAAEGALTVVADLNLEGAEEVVRSVKESGGEATALHVDLEDIASVHAMVHIAVNHYGCLDILHNNAAATRLAARSDLPILKADPHIWDQTMRINLRGTLVATQAALPHMIARGGGSIINTASVSGLLGDLSNPAYGASKAAVISLTQYTATQYGKQGIRCNAIAPGYIPTPATGAAAHEALQDTMLRHSLTPRIGEPEDIAAAVVFLASDEATHITGQVLTIDGGLLAHQPYVADLRT